MTPIAYLTVSRADYAEFKAGCVDGHEFPSDHDSFLKRQKEFSDGIEANGVITTQISINPKDFFRWCAHESIPADGRARTRYAALIHDLKSQE